MKNKGFMLVETLIASTVILGALIFLFIQFSSIKRAYETSFTHNTVQGLYSAKALADCLEANGYYTPNYNTTIGYLQLDKNNMYGVCSKIYDNISVRHVLYVGTNITSLQNSLKSNDYDNSIFDEKFKKFILEIDPIEYTKQGRLIIEYKDYTYAVISTNFKI